MARTYFIEAEEISVAKGWSIIDKINAKSTFSVTVVDKKSAVISEGKKFTIKEDGVKYFEGLIKNITVSEPYAGYLQYNLVVADNAAIANRRAIAKVYESETSGDIIKDIITEVLADEGVTQGTIEDGPTISKAVFNYIKCDQALDFIKKTTGGYNWNIDKDKKLNFFNRAANVSPFTLDDTVQHKDFKQNRDMDLYRNTQYIRGGKSRTATQSQKTPTPAPDGKSRSFLFRFPLAEEPVIEVNLNGAGWTTIPSADIGINGLDENKKWYWSYNSQTITQDESEVVLGTVDDLRGSYVGLRNLFVKVDNNLEVTDRASIEGGTGIYEDFTVEKSINETVQALEFGEGLLETYGEVKDKVEFSTEVAGLEAGQLLTIDKPDYGISDKFLIEKVVIKPLDGGVYEYKVTALDGASIGGWEEFFKELTRTGKDFAIEEDELLITLNSFAETNGVGGTLEISTFNASYPSETSYPAEDEYPNDEVISEVTLND